MKKSLFVGLLVFNLSLLCISNSVKASNHDDKDNKVILISFDGMKNDYTKKYVKDKKLPYIKQLQDKGVWAMSPSTISPSLTAPSHAAIATGATPKETGIVSNQWHEPNKALENKDDAFQKKIQVPPLWVEAREQGKTTATIAFPGANPKDGKQGNYSIFYGETWSPSNLDTLSFKSASDWVSTPKSFSPLKEAKLSIKMENKKNHAIYILAIDSTDDKKQNYQDFILSEDKIVGKEDAFTKGMKWESLSLHVKDNQTAGFWFKMKADNNDLNRNIHMYHTAVTSGLISGPKGFPEEIKQQFGFFPAQDDNAAFDKGWITREEYQDISTRFVMWITNVSLYIKQKYNPDLLMFYCPQIDHEQHKYLLTDPRQPGYSPETIKKYAAYIKWSYGLADKVVGKTLNSLNKNDYLFVVSDHGMEPAHSTLSPNKVLKDSGLLTLDKKNNIDFANSKAYAIPSGSIAHVYINLKDREKGGIVPHKDYEKVRNKINQAFKEVMVKKIKKGSVVQRDFTELLTALKTNNFSVNKVQMQIKDAWGDLFEKKIHPYEKVMKTTDKNKRLLGHPNSGDVVLIGAPGYMMGSGTTKSVTAPIELGTHGGDPERSMLRPVFMVTGPNIRKGKKINTVSNLDIAPTIYDLLELETPSFVEGKRIKGILEDQ